MSKEGTTPGAPMTPKALLDIADRCEREGPSRELDSAIVDALVGTPRTAIGGDAPYTRSIDSAVTLLPTGHEWLRKSPRAMTVYREPDGDKDWAQHIEAGGKTPALALCCAALRSRAALMGVKDE